MSAKVTAQRSTAIKDLIERAIELELIAETALIADGLPGASGRSAKALARGMRQQYDIGKPTVAAITVLADDDLGSLPGVAEGTLRTIRNGLLTQITLEEQRRSDEKRVTWEVIGERHTTPLTGTLTNVSNPCREGRHYRCSGKIALQQLQHGRRYTRCKCPFCAQEKDPNHTKKIRTMRLKE